MRASRSQTLTDFAFKRDEGVRDTAGSRERFEWTCRFCFVVDAAAAAAAAADDDDDIDDAAAAAPHSGWSAGVVGRSGPPSAVVFVVQYWIVVSFRTKTVRIIRRINP